MGKMINQRKLWTQVITTFPLRTAVVFAVIFLMTCLFALNLVFWKMDAKREKVAKNVLLVRKEGVHFKDLFKILDDQVYLAIITQNFHYKSTFVEYQNQMEAALHFFEGVDYAPLKSLQERIFSFIALEDFRAAEKTYESLSYKTARSNFYKHTLSVLMNEEALLKAQSHRYDLMHSFHLVTIALASFFYFLSWILIVFLMGKYSTKITSNLENSLATLAHDFRSPVAAILGYSECLREGFDGPITERQITSLKKIERIGHSLLAVMNDLLNMAKIQSGKVKLILESLDIGPLMRYAAEAIEPQMQSKHLEFKRLLPEESITLQIDGIKTTEILTNLLHNAMKFTKKGFVEFSYEICGEIFKIHVKDSGCGLSVDDMSRIFEPFVQADLTVKERLEGVGLGLTIAKHYAKLQGGELKVISKIGEGSTFTLSLPYEKGK